MATKRIKSVGNLSYWQNAAKQIEWPVDFEEKHISVPESELQYASEHLMVQHFCNNGFHIQSCIGDIPRTTVYVAPVSDKPIFRPIAKSVAPEAVVRPYQQGNKFRIKSTNCELEITHIESGKVHFVYTNRPHKAPLLNSIESLDKVLKMEVWERII